MENKIKTFVVLIPVEGGTCDPRGVCEDIKNTCFEVVEGERQYGWEAGCFSTVADKRNRPYAPRGYSWGVGDRVIDGQIKGEVVGRKLPLKGSIAASLLGGDIVIEVLFEDGKRDWYLQSSMWEYLNHIPHKNIDSPSILDVRKGVARDARIHNCEEIEVEPITDFMDRCNNEELDLDSYFISYVHVKMVEND